MAIWQFSFKIIPQEKIIRKYDFFPVKITDSDFEKLNDWKGFSISNESLNKISSVLEPTKSWSKDIKQFGHLEKSCIELIYDNKNLEEVNIRLDLRDLTKKQIESIIEFINFNNSIILSNESNTLFNASIDNLIDEIKKSNSYSFVKNPKSFLESISK